MPAELVKERCPLCGAPLLRNGDKFWCSFVGGGGQKALGIDEAGFPPFGLFSVMLARGSEHIRQHQKSVIRSIMAKELNSSTGGRRQEIRRHGLRLARAQSFAFRVMLRRQPENRADIYPVSHPQKNSSEEPIVTKEERCRRH